MKKIISRHLRSILSVVILAGIFIYSSTEQDSNNLSIYLKSWGLVRFRVPSTQDECKQIDEIALNGIESILLNNTKRNLNKEINKLLQITSKSINSTITTEDTSQLIANLTTKEIEWLRNPSLSKNNRIDLTKIFYSRPNSIPFNITISESNDPIELDYCMSNSNELIAANRIFGIGLLWNAVHYFFPYKDKIGKSWKTILPQFVQKAILCKTPLSYHLLTLELYGLLNDGHANVTSFELMKYWGFFTLPIELEIFDLDSLPIVTKVWKTLDKESKFEIGDRIISIDKNSFQDFLSINSKYISAGSSLTKYNNVCNKYVLNSNQQAVTVRIQRRGEIINQNVIPVSSGKLSDFDFISNYCTETIKQLADSICYLNLSKIEPEEFSEYYNIARKAKVTILDLRSYPSNILDTLANYYFRKPIAISSWSSPNFTFPGYSKRPDQYDYLGNYNNLSYSGKVIILVNNNTSSRGEYIALAFQALSNTITVGTQTSGTDGDILKIKLPGGLRAMFTSITISYPDGTSTFGDGIKLNYQLPKKSLFLIDNDPYIDYSVELAKSLWGI